MITLGLVDSVDDNGVYVTMPGSRGVVRGPFRAVQDVAVGASALVVSTDDGEQVVVGVASAPPRFGVFNVRDFGALGDGATDDTAAIQAALDAASAAKGVVLVPYGTYNTTASLTVGSDTDIVGTGTISGTIPGSNTRVIDVISVSDVSICGITVDGNKSAYVGTTEQKHGINLRGAARVVVRDVNTVNNKGDGVYVGCDTDDVPSTDVVLENVWSEYNHRQGLSITSASGVRVVGGSYSHTSGTNPQCGIDIEPDSATDEISAIEIVDVVMDDNAGAGIVVNMKDAPTKQAGVVISGGRASGNYFGVTVNGSSRGVRISGVLVTDNDSYGIELNGEDLTDIVIDGNTVQYNSACGITVNMPTGTVDGLTITNNAVLDNARYSSPAQPGILVDSVCTVFTAGNRVANLSTGEQNYGIVTTSLVVAETHIGNDLAGNVVGAASYGGTAAGRTVIGPSGVGFFGATPIGKPTVTGSRGGNAALASLLTQLANLGLITDSSS